MCIFGWKFQERQLEKHNVASESCTACKVVYICSTISIDSLSSQDRTYSSVIERVLYVQEVLSIFLYFKFDMKIEQDCLYDVKMKSEI